MPQFQYIAEDAHGTRHEGELSADSPDAAREQLRRRGLQVIDIEVVKQQREQPVSRLRHKEAEDVVITVAELSNSELPLADGLRAAAAEATSTRVARALTKIAADVEQGFALESVMTKRGDFLPPHVRGLVAAAAKSGRLGLALDDLIEHHRSTREVWATVLSAIAYPLLVLGMTLVVLAFFPIFIIPEFKTMFLEFELELPAITKAAIRFSDAIIWLGHGSGLWIGLIFGAAFFGILALGSFSLGTPAMRRFAITMPMVGPIWQWSGAAAFSRLLATMLEYDIPLPDALRLARDGVRDPEVRQVATLFAQGVENGSTLSDLMTETNRLPASITPFVRWGERTGKLPEALHSVADMLLLRVQMRTLLLRSVAPPVVFIMIGLLVGFMVVSMFLPLASLIQSLS